MTPEIKKLIQEMEKNRAGNDVYSNILDKDIEKFILNGCNSEMEQLELEITLRVKHQHESGKKDQDHLIKKLMVKLIQMKLDNHENQ